ncbi:kinectin isoform X5 [Pelobates fuscus]|uniref:kinectin isoform X5 n=1 Tax=Pelobates fuscus TaxID=191477 RepID=UPI002FE4BAC7
MEFYESTYFIILVPSVVITVIFLFFWLFMKETSYDEILAKQKKDQKLPPAKVDKRKTDKKKNKKKETQNGNLHESDSETANREFDLMDVLNEDEHVVPTPVIEAEPTVNIRERKKKDKKQPKPAAEEPAGKEINGTKTPGKKAETVPVTKQPTPPPDVAGSKKKQGQKKPKNGREDSPVSPEIKTEQVVPTIKKQEKENVVPLVEAKTQESVSVKKKAAGKKQKAESPPALVDDPFIQPTVFIPLIDNSADPIVVEKKVEKREAVHAEKPEGTPAPQKGGNKKVKTVTDKENAEMKFKDFLVTMKGMILSEEEAMNVVDMLKEKSRSVQEIIHKANKGDSVALHQLQEKEKLLVAARDEAVGTKEQCKHLAQELHAEKQKSSLIEAKARERISAMEKEHSAFQNKMHSSFQDAQQMQLKFQQVRDQLESQLTHLKQENGILRDAVSSATNQMESKQSSELNKLRQEYARLMNELTEKNNKMAQEEMQKKSSDQLASKLKAQLQESERRVEEAETFLRSRLAESDAIKQEIQSKLSIKENEIKSLHSKLTDTIVSNQQLEQRVLQLMEAGQNESLQMHVQELRNQNENLNIQIQKYHTQVQAQSSASVLVEELQKTITEKDKEMKQMENSLALERANFANSGEELKSIQRENISLKAELQKFQALMNEQVSAVQALEQMQKSISGKDEKIRTLEEQLQGELAKVSSNIEHYTANKEVLGKMEICMQEKDDKIKTVEELLETGLIEMANKEEELRTLRTENATLRKDVQNLKAQQANQISLSSVVEDLKNEIHEKEGKIKSVENLLQAEHLRADSQEKTVQVSSMAQIQELQNELKCKEEALKVSEGKSNERGSDVASKQRQLEDLQRECNVLKVHIEEVEKKLQQQDFVSSQVQDLQTVVQQKEEQIRILTSTLSDKEKHITDTSQEIQVLLAERESLKAHAYELQQKHEQQTQQVHSAVPSEELLKALSDKDRCLTDLQGEVESLKSSLDQQRKKNNDKQHQVHEAEAEARAILKNLFPNVSVSASLCHGEWVQEFEKLAKVFLNESVGAEKVKAMEQKLKEAEDIHSLLQIECEKYKSVLAETEGILQRLQRSVEEEECRWKIKVEESQKELKEVHSTVHSLEQELALLSSQEKQSQNLLKEREHLETELEKAEVERATYVSEVRELKELLTELQRKLDGSYSEAIRQNEELTLLKSQLSETLRKLEGEQNERQKVAKDLHEAQKSLDLIQLEILKSAGEPNVIENADISSETDGQERTEKVLPNLSQSVTQLQQCLQAVNQQLTKGGEHYQVIG